MRRDAYPEIGRRITISQGRKRTRRCAQALAHIKRVADQATLRASFDEDQTWADRIVRPLRRAMYPSPAKPIIIIAQVEGSGVPGVAEPRVISANAI
jgi:hypothetical protein